MKRAERIRRKASRVETVGMRRSIRATSFKNKLGRGAIRDGKLAERAYELAKTLRQYALDLESAAKREKKAKDRKLPHEWWK